MIVDFIGMPLNLKNNTYSATPKDDARDRIELEIGDSKKPQAFFPQKKWMRFDNEYNVSLRLINHGENSPTVRQANDQVSWKGSKKEAYFYELPVSAEHPEGASEFEIVLKEKPVTNKIEFSLVSKGVDF